MLIETTHLGTNTTKLVKYRLISHTPKYPKKVREETRECHNHKPQPFPDPKRKRKPTNLNKHKPNKRTKSTKISSLFPKQAKSVLYESQRDRRYLLKIAPKEDSNQPALPRRLIIVFCVHMKKLCILGIHEPNEDSDQTAMHHLI